MAQVFSCEYCEILRAPFVASGKVKTKSLKLAKFQFQLFLTTLDMMGFLYIVTEKYRKTKIFVLVSVHISFQTLKHLK